MSDTDKS
jgi:hypothetical protein